jgi:prolyl-tRNA synthetase
VARPQRRRDGRLRLRRQRGGFHLTGVNFGRDLPEPATVADIRNVVVGDPSPDGKGTLELCRGIEVGHIFQLRTKYAEALKCSFLDEQGKDQVMEMGCYGIGVSRIVGAAIEQGHDERGIIFPAASRPSPWCIVPMGLRQERSRCAPPPNALYAELLAAGIDVHPRRSRRASRARCSPTGTDRRAAPRGGRRTRPQGRQARNRCAENP